MKKKVEVDVEVPEGWRVKEIVNRFEKADFPGTGVHNHFRHVEGKGLVYFTAILEPEPTAIQAIRAALRWYSPNSEETYRIDKLFKKAIAEYEEASK